MHYAQICRAYIWALQQQLTISGLSTAPAMPCAARRGGGGDRRNKGNFLLKGDDNIRTEYLLNKELEHVLAVLTPSNALVCQVCLHTGLRVGDVLNLKTAQIKPRFWVTEQKTGKRRMVGLPEALREAILEQAGEVWAFPGTGKTGHRTRQAVWKDVKRAARMFRLDQNVAPHSFRKVYAVDLYEQYGDLKPVQKALNHSSEATTILYACAAQMLKSKRLKKAARRGKRL